MPNNQFYPLTIADISPETDKAKCVGFSLPAELKEAFAFAPGQFLTFRAKVRGKELTRSYSICSDATDPLLRVAVKRVRGGKFSRHVNTQWQVGDRIEVMPPQGTFVVNVQPKLARNYMCIAVGSGITPILSIIKSILYGEPHSQITLIYGNRNSRSVMFRETLCALKNHYMSRFQWINIMSQEDQGSTLLNGRIDNRKGALFHKQRMIDIYRTDEVFICGPESMMSEVSHGFRQLGLKEEHIHYELFATSPEEARLQLERARQRREQYGEDDTSQVTMKINGRAIKFDLTLAGSNILDAGLNHGIALPYSCKSGICCTCKAKLIDGEVSMDSHSSLSDDEIKGNIILTCQSHPTSDAVTVDFDLG